MRTARRTVGDRVRLSHCLCPCCARLLLFNVLVSSCCTFGWPPLLQTESVQASVVQDAACGCRSTREATSGCSCSHQATISHTSGAGCLLPRAPNGPFLNRDSRGRACPACFGRFELSPPFADSGSAQSKPSAARAVCLHVVKSMAITFVSADTQHRSAACSACVSQLLPSHLTEGTMMALPRPCSA